MPGFPRSKYRDAKWSVEQKEYLEDRDLGDRATGIEASYIRFLHVRNATKPSGSPVSKVLLSFWRFRAVVVTAFLPSTMAYRRERGSCGNALCAHTVSEHCIVNAKTGLHSENLD